MIILLGREERVLDLVVGLLNLIPLKFLLHPHIK